MSKADRPPQKIVIGIDPSTTNVGWAVLAPVSGEYQLAGCGSFSPGKRLRWPPQKDIEAYDRIRSAYRALATFIPAIHDGTNRRYVAGIEQVTFMMVSLQAMATGASMSAVSAAAFWESGADTLPVTPTSWQSMIKAPGLSTKERSKLLATTLYGAPHTIDEDTADAIAIAHYTAHHRGYMNFIDQEIATLEIGVNEHSANMLGRAAVEGAKGAILRASKPSRKLSKAFIVARNDYVAALQNFRKREALPPKTKAKIDPTKKPRASLQPGVHETLDELSLKLRQLGARLQAQA